MCKIEVDWDRKNILQMEDRQKWITIEIERKHGFNFKNVSCIVS